MNALGNLHLDAAIPITVAAMSLKAIKVSHKTPFLLRRVYEDLSGPLLCSPGVSLVLSWAFPCSPARSCALLCSPGLSCLSWALLCPCLCLCLRLRFDSPLYVFDCLCVLADSDLQMDPQIVDCFCWPTFRRRQKGAGTYIGTVAYVGCEMQWLQTGHCLRLPGSLPLDKALRTA